jgi:hypothetical protein
MMAKNFFFKIIFTLTCLIAFIPQINAQSENQVIFPKLETVVNEFCTRYNPELSPEIDLVFEKRASGWHVTQMQYISRKVLKSNLFWSVNTQNWKKIDYPQNEENEYLLNKRKQKLIQNSNAWYANRMPYYNYVGYRKDVIDLLSNRTSLSDTLRFALATAWLEQTITYCYPQYSFSDSSVLMNLSFGKNAMSPSQLSTYIEGAKMANKHFKILADEYPNFETIVGLSRVKYANCVMTFFLNLQYLQDEETALKYLNEYESLPFGDFLLESACNMLNSCPQNGILFTWGDNDTFPLLYVQAKEKYRSDVKVVNLSLAAMSRYAVHLRDAIFDAPKTKLQLPASFYNDAISEYIYFNKDADSSIYWVNLLRYVQSPNKEMQYDHIYCNAKSVWLRSTTTNKPEDLYKKVQWNFTKSYVLRSEILVLDMINSTWKEQTVCFAATVPQYYLEGFKQHFRLQGLVYRFNQTPKTDDFQNDFLGSLDEELSFDKFTKIFKFESTDKIGTAEMPAFTVCNVFFYYTAKRFLKAGNKEKAMALADLKFKVFPNIRLEWDFDLSIWAELYSNLDNEAKALQVCRTIVENSENKLLEDGFGNNAVNLNRLKEVATKYKDNDLFKRLEKL